MIFPRSDLLRIIYHRDGSRFTEDAGLRAVLLRIGMSQDEEISPGSEPQRRRLSAQGDSVRNLEPWRGTERTDLKTGHYDVTGREPEPLASQFQTRQRRRTATMAA